MPATPTSNIYYLISNPTLNCLTGGVILPSAQMAGVQPPSGAVVCTLAQFGTPSAWSIVNGQLQAVS